MPGQTMSCLSQASWIFMTLIPRLPDAAVNFLRHIASVSNSNLIRNAEGLLCRKDIEPDVEWVGGVTRTTPDKFKVSY